MIFQINTCKIKIKINIIIKTQIINYKTQMKISTKTKKKKDQYLF